MKRTARLISWTVLALAMVALAVALTWLRWRGLPFDVARSLATADTYELISLNPHEEDDPSDYHRHKVLGHLMITDPAVRQRLNAALQAGVRESDGTRAMCFVPRHAIRLMNGGKVLDLAICFECEQIYIYREGQEIEYRTVTPSPQPVFDDVLTKAGVPLAPKGPE